MHFFHVIHRFLACFFMPSVHLIVCLLVLLEPLRWYHIVAACAHRLWSNRAIWFANLSLISCATYDTLFICVIFLAFEFLVCCWTVISNIVLSIISCAVSVNVSFLFGVNIHVWTPYNNVQIMHFSNISLLILRFCDLYSYDRFYSYIQAPMLNILNRFECDIKI